MTCHYLDLGSASDWLKQFFLISYSQKHMLLVIINDCFVSCIPCSFLFFLFPLFPFSLFVSLVPPLLVPPCSFVPLVRPSSPLFPCPPLFLLFPLFPLVPPCSRLFPYFLLFPLSPFVSLVAPFAPCSPVSLVCLQFTTLNVWQPQISVNKKNRSPLRGSPLKSRIPSHKHVTEKVLHLIWWGQLVQEIRKVRAKLRESETYVSPKLLGLYQLCEVTGCVRVFLQCFLLDKKSLLNKQLKK